MGRMAGDTSLVVWDIHVDAKYQKNGLGKHLLTLLELIARRFYMDIYIYIYVFSYAYLLYVYVFTYIYIYMYISICIHIYICIYIYIYIY
jgi:GNAT superfamily N-acetyltransferase